MRSRKTLDTLDIKENVNTQGLKMKVIAYRHSYDCDIEFEDGTIIKNIQYDRFIKGTLQNPNYKRPHFRGYGRIGEVNINRSGQKMKIVEYTGYSNVIVEFEDGTKRHCDYTNFKKGYVSKIDKYKSKERLGLKRTINEETYEIVEYNNALNIKVKRLSDGKIFNSTYEKFSKGNIPITVSPRKRNHWVKHLYDINIDLEHGYIANERVGEIITHNGYTFKIVNYVNSDFIVIQCLENRLYLKTRYTYFVHRQFNTNFDNNIISRPKRKVDHTGETITKRNGDIMTIIAYRNCRDFDVQFSDGTIVNGKLYSDFQKGIIRNPNNKKYGKW